MKKIQSKISAIIVTVMLIFAASAANGERAPWDCTNCGRKGNTGNFCGACANPAPKEESDPKEDAESAEMSAEELLSTGMSYYEGNGVEQNDAKAVEYFRKAADQGHAEAQFRLGNCYANGTGVEKNEKTAAEYYRLAADQGNTQALYALGESYMTGRGVDQNDQAAVQCYQLAADEGLGEAQLALARCYESGQDVEANLLTAYRYAAMASKGGLAAAGEKADSLKQTIVDGRTTVTFGACEQNNILTDGSEPMEWYVLDLQDDQMLLLGKYGFDSKKFDESGNGQSWENASIRRWLNSEFLNKAFSPQEKEALLLTSVDNAPNQGYGE